jgi:VanZ family protein
MDTCKPTKLISSTTIGILALAAAPITFDLSYNVQLFNNWMHIPAFAVITIVFLQLSKNFQLSGWLWFTGIVFVLLSIGIVMEAVQVIIPGRISSIADMFRNIVGIFFGIVLFSLTERLKPGLIRQVVCR